MRRLSSTEAKLAAREQRVDASEHLLENRDGSGRRSSIGVPPGCSSCRVPLQEEELTLGVQVRDSSARAHVELERADAWCDVPSGEPPSTLSSSKRPAAPLEG